jgi:hypothetical protein
VVEELAAAAAVVRAGVVLDRAVRLPAAVLRGAAQVGDAAAVQRAVGEREVHAATAARGEAEGSRPFGDGEPDPVGVLVGVELHVALRAEPVDEGRDLLDRHLGLLDEAHEPAEVGA